MSEFVNLMKYAVADNKDKPKLLSRFQNPNIVKLLQSEDIENTTLIQEEVYKTVLEGAEPQLCMREALPVLKVKSNALRYVMGESGTYAEEVAEGAEIPIDTQDYSKTDFVIKKIGRRPLITNELIEDGLFDVIALELKKAGAALENKLNMDALNTLINSAIASEALTSAGIVQVSDIATAIGKVKKNNFIPDTLILSPTAESTLLRDSNLVYVNRAGDNSALRGGNIGATLLGLKPYTTSVTGDGWGGETSGDTLALVIDRTHAGAIAMRRDLTIEQYKDPIRDLAGMSITMRYDVKSFFSNAIVKITTT